MIIDLFEIKDFLIFLKSQYPEINIESWYDPIIDEMNITICHHKSYNYYYGTFPANDTKEAIRKINALVINFLASYQIRG